MKPDFKVFKTYLSSGKEGYQVVLFADDDPDLGFILHECRSKEAAGRAKAFYSSLPDDALVSIALKSIASMNRILAVAERISSSSDQAGEQNYATKSHMRAWGHEIFNIVYPIVHDMRVQAGDVEGGDA